MTAGTLVNAKTVRIEPPITQSHETIDKVLKCIEEAIIDVKAEFNLSNLTQLSSDIGVIFI